VLIAEVIVELSLDRKFDYAVPHNLENAVRPGVRVEVPFGKSSRVGCVLSVNEVTQYTGKYKLKEIISIQSNSPQLPEKLLQLGNWMADYYCCSYEQAVKALLPGAVRRNKSNNGKRRYALADLTAADDYLRSNIDKKSCEKRIKVLQTLMQDDDLTADEIELACGAGASVVKALLDAGLLKISSVDPSKLRKQRSRAAVAMDKPRTPTAEQQTALNGIFELLDHPEAQVRTGLLFGVTGSGKTEVYLQSIAHALELGKSAIVLVPEISLTPQTVRRFRARFGDLLAVLHSRLSDAERREEWQKIYQNKVRIAIGARSALFAPLTDLGLIVVDEEHENSYKQSEAPRYSARDVAVMRGKLENAAVVLGSATPSLETYYNALNGKYKLWKLEHRAEDSPLPQVKVVDLATAKANAAANGEKSSLFAPELVTAIRERLRLKEQVILFLNRRGFARELACQEGDCTWIAECPDCSKPYIYHKSRQMLSCGLCGRIEPAPQFCPTCRADVLKTRGVGTERIEETAKRLFANARIERMDSDTMRTADAHEITLEKFRRGEIDILIGTQMIAKGLDFPNVTLVGVINADSGLNIPDLRSSERTFQLLTQVAGRAGRGDKHGEVYIQTYSPYNDVIRYAVAQDFPAFYEYDSAVRQILNYPPFGHLIALYARGENESDVVEVINTVFNRAKNYCHESVTAVEPAPAPLSRIKGKYRYLATFRGEKLTSVRKALRHMVLHEVWKSSVELYLDMDAQNLT